MGFSTRFTGKGAQAVLLAVLVSGLSAEISETRPRVGVPEDWTHHRIKFSTAKLRQHPELAAHGSSIHFSSGAVGNVAVKVTQLGLQ